MLSGPHSGSREPAEPQTQDEAHAIIDQIRFDRGILDDEDRAELRKNSAKWRQKYEDSAKRTREALAAFTRIASTQLYSSKSRFIYELIQNADDSSYLKCTEHKRVPSLKFTVRPDEIIIDSPEDGFTVADVFAICSTGQSSKLKNLDTTGEKGLGFKSVFAFSDCVSIFSGLWSFQFRCSRGDNGLGMVVPYWIDPSESERSSSYGTRIVLRLRQMPAASHRDLVAAFKDVPDTTLLFLRKLQSLEILFEHSGSHVSVHRFARLNQWNDNERSIAVCRDGKQNEFVYKMHLNECSVTPKDWSSSDDTTAKQRTKVILAFPVQRSNGAPIISSPGHHTFTFLPMKRLDGLPFVIQADFATTASRETVTDETRNVELRDAIVKLFVAAVEQLCCSSTSRYSWTGYVPSDQLDGFWQPLRHMIKTELASKRLLAAQGEDGVLHCISELHVVPDIFQHSEEPLLPSMSYLSRNYDKSAVATLKSLGLQVLDVSRMLELVRLDLSRDATSSTIKSTELGDSWHETFADFLLQHVCSNRLLRKRLEKLTFLPLSRDHTSTDIVWVTPQSMTPSNKVYLPKIDDSDDSPIVHPELGLSVIHMEACVTPARRKLLNHWGIGHVEESIVKNAVLTRNRLGTSLSIPHFVAHLAILFWYKVHVPLTSSGLLAVDTRSTVLSSARLHFRSTDPHSVWQLLDGKIDHPNFGFLHEMYLNDPVRRHINDDGESWRSWLESKVGIRSGPALIDLSFPGLSPLFQEIMEKKPSMVVGTLKTYWSEYRDQVSASPEVLSALKNAAVASRTGQTTKLCETVLPTELTIEKSRLFGVEKNMRFMQIGKTSEAVSLQDWSFLQQFGVCLEPLLDFHLHAMRHLMKRLIKDSVLPYVAEVYKSIGCIATLRDRGQLRDFFTTNNAIYANNRWLRIEDCVWHGPNFPISKTVLMKEYANDDFAREFFTGLLGIRDATHHDILHELTRLSALNKSDHPGNQASMDLNLVTLSNIYSELEKSIHWTQDGLASEYRSKFETLNIVYDGKRWTKLSSCVWSSPVSLRGKIILKRLYPGLQNLFVKRLGVQSMSTVTMLEEMIRMVDNGVHELDETKSMLREIASMLANEEPNDKIDDLLKKLKHLNFLPLAANIRSPQEYVSAKDRFLIVDDRRLGDAFSGKARLLDFSANELASMQPLYDVLRLGNRYLSRHVRMETSFQDSTVSTQLTDDIRTRSYAISCCALTYKTNHEQAQYVQKHRMLMNCEIHLSSSLCTTFAIGQGEQVCKVESGLGLPKIDEKDGIVRIFVPKDNSLRQRCFRAHLPGHLLRFLDLSTQNAEKQIYRILNDPISTMDEVLSEEGILMNPELERYQSEFHQASDEQSTSSSSTMVHFGQSSLAQDLPFRPAIYLDNSFARGTIETISSDQYRRVLEHVYRQAQSIGVDGSMETSDSVHQLRLDLGIVPGQEVSPSVFQRIGAAGELFVFERLRALGLTDLRRSDWRSTIRHLVSVLPQYQGVGSYNETEDADIIYKDHTRSMERILRDETANAFPTWADDQGHNHAIEFYVEVKTTINGCDEKFYMSHKQYNLMSEKALLQGRRPAIVYVVARVFDLLSERVGVKFYTDPKSLEDNVLRFDCKGWEITSQT